MNTQLTPLEARVIGCLIEKEITTPDQYPLSLNALTNACNQKTNRDPVLSLTEAVVQETVDALIKRYLIRSGGGFGSRVTKYQHKFCNSEFGQLQLDPAEVAIVCELLLRGAQTPGELRTRAERLGPLGDVAQVEKVLAGLAEREHPLVVRLAREPGRREARYMHTFFGDTGDSGTELAVELRASAAAKDAPDDRIARLEREVAELRRELDELKQSLGG